MAAGLPRGGNVSLYYDGKKVGEGRVERTVLWCFLETRRPMLAAIPLRRSAQIIPALPAYLTGRSTRCKSIWARTPMTTSLLRRSD